MNRELTPLTFAISCGLLLLAVAATAFAAGQDYARRTADAVTSLLNFHRQILPQLKPSGPAVHAN